MVNKYHISAGALTPDFHVEVHAVYLALSYEYVNPPFLPLDH